MNQLSVVIVNYNVKHFLEQVLLSVEVASKGLTVETWVVDNNSVDGSIEMVKEKFPWVKLIENHENVGFSRANNQALRLSNAKYSLLLNPDTVLQEDTFVKCIEYLDANPNVGGLGVRMIDGKGQFLPESKRGLPTPSVAFFKMTGLASLFPKSKYFGRYHMKYLSEFETHEVEILAGAFMMMRGETLAKVGLLDEQFFMYGEDIDLSYRIILGGYKNVYFADTTIIHYKGESTKKKSVNYVKVFYNAMVLFAKKHYSKRMAGWFSFWIQIAIYLRASVALIFQSISKVLFPAIDFIIIYLGFYGIAKYWELYHKFVRGFYPDEYYLAHIPIYTLVAMVAVYVSGGYDRPYKPYRLFRGALIGSVLMFAIYGFYPKEWQFSRAILGLGSAWAVGGMLMIRVFADLLGWKGSQGKKTEKRILVVGGNNEVERITDLLNKSGVPHVYLGAVTPNVDRQAGFLGSFNQLDELVEIYRANSIIFSGKDVSASRIMDSMSGFSKEQVQLKIAPESSEFIIGSDSKNEPGELFTLEVKYQLSEYHMLRRKRIFDVLGIVLLIIRATIAFGYPLFRSSRWRYVFGYIPKVLLGKMTWVSYHGQLSAEKLPVLKPGVISSAGVWTGSEFEADVNHLYAKDYDVWRDLEILWDYLKNQ